METVQLQCGQCKKLIGIRVEHLGMQVQCPHCKSVVQTPAPASDAATLPPPSPPPAPPSGFPNMELNPRESIFGGAEETDSVIDDPVAPKMELPPMPAPAPTAPSYPEATTAPAPEANAEADFRQFKRKPTFDKSVVPLLMLIFLVPYALMTTAFIAYLLFVQPRSTPHPLDYLPDPASGKDKGGARPALYGIKHNTALADHQRTTIGQSIKAGDLLVTPTHIFLTPDGDLKLILKARNVSTNTKFEPINGVYLRPSKTGIQPYAFLESKSGTIKPLNAVDLGYHKDPKAADIGRGDALLKPGEETTIALTTDLRFRNKEVSEIAKAADSYTWRVQVRRGFVKVDGKDVPATTVIGVDFTGAQIERPKG